MRAVRVHGMQPQCNPNPNPNPNLNANPHPHPNPNPHPHPNPNPNPNPYPNPNPNLLRHEQLLELDDQLLQLLPLAQRRGPLRLLGVELLDPLRYPPHLVLEALLQLRHIPLMLPAELGGLALHALVLRLELLLEQAVQLLRPRLQLLLHAQLVSRGPR